jgi:predicted dehydrogenase
VKKLKIAVVGAGRLGGFHAHKLVGFPHVELVAVVDPDPVARNRLAGECNTAALAEHGPLLGQVDAVVIAAPTRLHHPIARDLLEAGIHLLVEKPLSRTAGEADELIRQARSRRLVLQVGHVERFNPALAAAAPHLRQPKYIEAVRASGFTFRSLDVGVVLDLMIHDIDLVLSLVHAPLVKVEASGLVILGGHEDVANARLEFACGCVATLAASRVAYEAARRMQVWSPRAMAAIDLATRTTTLVRPSETLLHRRFHPEELSAEQVEYYKEHLLEEHLPREQKRFEAVDALALELQDFVEAILTPREPRVPGEAGRDAVAVAEQILERIAAGAGRHADDGPLGLPAAA